MGTARTIVLVLIAIVIGVIWYGIKNPDFFSNLFNKIQR